MNGSSGANKGYYNNRTSCCLKKVLVNYLISYNNKYNIWIKLQINQLTRYIHSFKQCTSCVRRTKKSYIIKGGFLGMTVDLNKHATY